MSVLAVIPARYESSRFPGKPLVDIFGQPMIQWVYENCKKSKQIDKLVIATDDERIKTQAEAFSAEVIMTSPEHQSGTDRCAEVLEKFKSAEEHFEIVVNIQGDEPFINAKNIDALISCIRNSDKEIGTLAKPFLREEVLNNPNRVKIRKNEKNIQFFRELKGDEDYYLPGLKHIGMYAYRSDVLKKITTLPMSSSEKELNLEQLRWLDSGYQIEIAIIDNEGPSVDTPEDLQKIIEKGKAHWC